MMLSTMAFWATVVQDGCDYARLRGANVESITSSDILPFLEVGLSRYRSPMYYSDENEWNLVFTDICHDYPNKDWLQELARWLVFASAIIGGSLALFLWCSTCFSFSIRTWRFCAFEAFLAAMLRSGSFLFLLSPVCSDSESTCTLSFGAKMDVVAIGLWVVTTLVMGVHYAEPQLRRVQTSSNYYDDNNDDDDDDGGVDGNYRNGYGKNGLGGDGFGLLSPGNGQTAYSDDGIMA